MPKNILKYILFIILLASSSVLSSQNIARYQLGMQLNAGFNHRPQSNTYYEQAPKYFPLSFAIEFGKKNTWFIKSKITNVAYVTEKFTQDGFNIEHNDNTNVLQFAIGYNFLHNQPKELIRVSLCLDDFIEQSHTNHIDYSDMPTEYSLNQKFYYGLEITYRHEWKYNLGFGFEFNYGRANYFDKYFFSNYYEEVFCVSVLLSYSVKSR